MGTWERASNVPIEVIQQVRYFWLRRATYEKAN